MNGADSSAIDPQPVIQATLRENVSSSPAAPPPLASNMNDAASQTTRQTCGRAPLTGQTSSPPEKLPTTALWLWGGGPALILLAAALMRTGDDRQVLVPGWNIPLPETCAMYSRFGIDCPGCGLTRAFIHLAHADPLTAWELNPLSWFLFAYVAIQIPLAIARARGMQAFGLPEIISVNHWGMVTIMIALVLRWLINISVGVWLA